jgi:hypothetical protein
MLAPFPDSAIINVPGTAASDLLRAAEDLPLYDNKDFYSVMLQSLVADVIHEKCRNSFEWLTGTIGEKVARRPYCVLVRGLRFDKGNRLFVAINRAFGKLVALPYSEPRAQLIQYIEPYTDRLSARGGRETERLHTDAADWGTPIRFISMVCVRADPRGDGRSRLLDIDAIREEVQTQLGNDSLQLLETQPVPWQLHLTWGRGVRWQTVLTESTICWRRYTILLAIDDNGAELSKEMLTLIDEFERVVENSDRRIDFLLQEGDLLFSDNTRGVHSRTPISDPETSNRLMIRSWIDAAQTEQ